MVTRAELLNLYAKPINKIVDIRIYFYSTIYNSCAYVPKCPSDVNDQEKLIYS